MSKYITQKNDISTYLEFSNLQIASEAFIGKSQSKDPGTIVSGNRFGKDDLISGNGHTSKFTETAADAFMQHWRVVEHITNTKTGFSGTLFEALEDIPGAGVKAGDQVLSFRSTEFVDDEVRDSQATNTLEISDRGFAFGQISDLRDWVGQMRAKNLMKDHISVTGYSLGGHLATAFYKLNEEGAFPGLNIDRTYTFNGAGIGKLKNPQSMTLSKVLDNFEEVKDNGTNDFFKTEIGKNRYKELKEISDSIYKNNKDINEEEFKNKINKMKSIIRNAEMGFLQEGDYRQVDMRKTIKDKNNKDIPNIEGAGNSEEIEFLSKTVKNIVTIYEEWLRIKDFHEDKDSEKQPFTPRLKDIISMSLDYQVAASIASQYTESYGIKSGANRILRGDKLDTELKNNFYDIMGDTYPSMVALSQKHFGEDIRIGIEDQPISRGWYKWNATISSLYNLGIKLFVDHYGKNDFGDTHSIILLTDSLVTQELLKQLDDDFTYEKFKPILKLASNIDAHQDSVNDDQGVAEGDALENVVNSISRALNIKTTHLNGNTIGGTWADTENKVVSGKVLHGRNDLHKTIKEISDTIANKSLGGKFHILDSNEITIDKVRNDFGYFIALKHLSPIVLSSKNQEANAIWQNLWAEDYKNWQNDRDTAGKGIAQKYSNEWIRDRLELLKVRNIFYNNNANNTDIMQVDTSKKEFVNNPGKAPNFKISNTENAIKSLAIHYAKGHFSNFTTYDFDLIDKENDFSMRVEDIASKNNTEKSDRTKNSVQFGKATGDTLTGYNGKDHLYGSAEADTLEGKEGDDYLEGKEGHDTYKLTSNDNGVDTIFDSDGKGSLEIDGEGIGKQTFTGLINPKSTGNAGIPYFTEDKKYRVEKIVEPAKDPAVASQVYWRFSVKDSTGGYRALAKLKPRSSSGEWIDGDLGLTLKQANDPNAGLDPSTFNPYDAGTAGYYYYNAASSPRPVKIHGSNTHSSQFNGSRYDDVFYTGNGVLHHVVSAGGNDYIVGGDGREYIMAGMHRKGEPWQNDDDTVFAGGNSDIVTGGDGNDQLHADDGNDNYEKPLPDESTQTEDGKRGDWISGQYGSDTITGSAKKDVLTGGEGDDTIRAGAGDDLVLGDANYVPSGMSNGISATEITIEKRWLSNGGTEEFRDTEVSVPGDTAFKWTWSHDGKDFSVNPGKGARMAATDRVQGTGNDTLYGGAGNDWMAGQAGNDEMYGDDGDDTIFGDDAVAMPAGFASGDDNLFAGKGKDKLHGGAGNDVLDASDDDNDKDELSGDEGDDQLNGGTGGDELNGGADNDVLRAGKDKTLMDGGSGNDIYFSNSGDDTMTDEDGDDHYYISAGTDSIQDSGTGHDGYHITFSHLMPPGVTTIHDSDGKGFITYQGRAITNDGVRATAENEWVTDTGAKLTRDGSNLVLSNGPKGSQGKVIFTGFFNSEEFLGLKLPSLDDDNKPNPDPKTQPDPKPQPEQPQAPTAGKPLAAQSVHEKEKLTYTLAEDTFHTANKDDKLTYSARLADGKPLPGWLSFNPQTRTFSGTPGNDDVGMLNVEISAKGKGGSANQRFTLNVINVNDAPQAGQKLPTLQIEHNKLFYYQLPEDAFKDIDKNDKLTFSATSENGQSLPSWLKFDAYNGTFTGSPSANMPQGNYRVTVTVTDSGGLKAHQTLVLNLAQGTPLKPVNGTDRNDVLISSADNELLAGKGGKDVYQFSRGFGHDLINNHDENSNQDDVVTFTNMNRKDFVIMRDYTSLYLRSLSGTDELRIMGQFPANSKWRIGEIRFADGSILTADEIERELQKTTEGDDHIYGSNDNDIINGKGGNDVISGEEGDDELYGEDGNDNLIGSVGNDKLSGGAGEDSLNGGDGRDHLSGGAGNDELIGGEDDDQLHGNEGDDKLYGGTGNDLLIGDSGNDVLSGSAGNDIYRFARGFGHDVINNYDGGLERHDSIDFSDMNRSDFDIRREGNNLVLHSKDGKNQITVTNHFFNGWQIDSIRFADGTTLDHGAINSAVSTQNAPRGNYMHPAAQALQMNQMIASLNNQAQPLHALAIPDEKQPLLAAVNPY